MKNTSFKFASETIHPGETLTLALPLPQVFSCAPLYMPIKLIHGKQQGPTLLLTAALFGNELNGTEIIQRLVNLPIMSKIKGTLIAIPVMNVHGLINRSRYLPDGIDLNRHFPGSRHGSNAERLANIFVNEIYNRSEYCINLQTGPLNYFNFPILQYYSENAVTLELTKTFHSPIVVKSAVEQDSLQALAFKENKPFLNYIAGEAMRFDQNGIKVGMHGILNIMRKLEMLPPQSKPERKRDFLNAKELKWVLASASGTHHTKIKVGQKIKAGDLLSVIKDPFGSNDNIKLESPHDGIIVGRNNTPLIHEGDSLFQIALYHEMAQEISLEDWHDESTVTHKPEILT